MAGRNNETEERHNMKKKYTPTPTQQLENSHGTDEAVPEDLKDKPGESI